MASLIIYQTYWFTVPDYLGRFNYMGLILFLFFNFCLPCIKGGNMKWSKMELTFPFAPFYYGELQTCTRKPPCLHLVIQNILSSLKKKKLKKKKKKEAHSKRRGKSKRKC